MGIMTVFMISSKGPPLILKNTTDFQKTSLKKRPASNCWTTYRPISWSITGKNILPTWCLLLKMKMPGKWWRPGNGLPVQAKPYRLQKSRCIDGVMLFRHPFAGRGSCPLFLFVQQRLYFFGCCPLAAQVLFLLQKRAWEKGGRFISRRHRRELFRGHWCHDDGCHWRFWFARLWSGWCIGKRWEVCTGNVRTWVLKKDEKGNGRFVEWFGYVDGYSGPGFSLMHPLVFQKKKTATLSPICRPWKTSSSGTRAGNPSTVQAAISLFWN